MILNSKFPFYDREKYRSANERSEAYQLTKPINTNVIRNLCNYNEAYNIILRFYFHAYNYKQIVSYDHQQENRDTIETNLEAIGQNEIYEEVNEYTNSIFNVKHGHNISYCS